MKKISILTGAGISAESGLKTFRDAGGLWEGHKVEDVATPQAFRKNPHLVNEFYNQRRMQLLEVSPNVAHYSLAKLETKFDVVVITQNVDNLHERGGSSKVVHLHGELTKVRSTYDESYVINWDKDLTSEDFDPNGYPLRPHIVWFGEQVPMLNVGVLHVAESNIVIIIGTSMQVYPAASLIQYAPHYAEVYYIDPSPTINYELSQQPNLHILKGKASIETPKLVEKILST